MEKETLSREVLAILDEWKDDYHKELDHCKEDHFICWDGRDLDLFGEDGFPYFQPSLG